MGIYGSKARPASGVAGRRSDGAGTTEDPASIAGSATAWRYLALVVTTIGLAAAGFVVLVMALDVAGRRPPPAFSNSYCLDAKLAAFRENPPVSPTHLILGSSVPWRNVSAGTIREQHPQARPLNASFCGLMVNQSAFVGRYFLKRFPTVSDVLLVLDPLDMSACRSKKTEVFDSADLSDYLSGGNDLPSYFKYFDFVSLVGNAFNTANGASIKYPVTRLGDGPLLRGEMQELVYGAPPEIQPACVAALAAFATELDKGGRRLVVATMPVLGDWSERYDPDLRSRRALAAGIKSALAGTSAGFWDGWSALTLPRADYFDALHLHWRAVPAFTRQLMQATNFVAAAD